MNDRMKGNRPGGGKDLEGFRRDRKRQRRCAEKEVVFDKENMVGKSSETTVASRFLAEKQNPFERIK